MKFISIEYKNFWAVGNTAIKVDLDQYPTTILSGKNGSGKSTVLEAISYCYFGKLLSNVNLSCAINDTNKKKMVITGIFEKQGDVYKVRRGEKPKLFEIYKNDELMDQSATSREYQKMLELIIGLDFKTFCQTIVLNKERYVPFIEMKPAQRRQVVDEILDVALYTEMDEIVRSRITSLNKDYDAASRKHDVEKSRIDGQDTLIQSIRQNITNAEASTADECSRLNEQLDELMEEAAAIIEMAEKIKIGKNDSDAFIREIDQYLYQFKRDLEEAAKTQKFFQKNSVCPTCQQDISVDTITEKMAETEAQIKEVSELLEAAKKERRIASEKLDKHTAKEREKARLQQQFSDKEREMGFVQKNIERLSKQAGPEQFFDQLKNAEDKKTQMIAEVERQRQDLIAIEGEIKEFEYLRRMTKDDGIKSMIISEYLPILNRKINEYLNAMEFYVGLTLNENFEESFTALNKEGFSFNQLSTGQKCRVNLAVWLSLLEVASIKNKISLNFLMLDEILEPMDTEGVEQFVRLIKEKLPSKNVFIITQRSDEFRDLFDNSVRFKLVDDFTEIDTDSGL